MVVLTKVNLTVWHTKTINTNMIGIHRWSCRDRACSTLSTPKTSTKWRSSCHPRSCTPASASSMQRVRLLSRVSSTGRTRQTEGSRCLSLHVQPELLSRQTPPSGCPTSPPGLGDPSSAAWSTVGWQGSMRTNARCPVHPRRKVCDTHVFTQYKKQWAAAQI